MSVKLYYERQGIRLFHGDCGEVASSLEPEALDCVVTSPPYNQLDDLPEKGSGLWAKSQGGAGFLRAWKERGYSDKVSEPEYQDSQRQLFSLIGKACKPTASLHYNHQVRWRDGECLHPIDWFRPEGWELRQEIIWDRGGGMMFNARMFVRFDERILWFVRGKGWKWNQESVGMGTIWRIAREQQQQGKLHPVAFPVEVPERCIVATTDEGDLVLDPFSGSATTGIACIRTGRRFVGCELSEEYCEIAAKRIDRELDQQRIPFPEPAPKPVQKTLEVE